jgi:hypothetical protein
MCDVSMLLVGLICKGQLSQIIWPSSDTTANLAVVVKCTLNPSPSARMHACTHTHTHKHARSHMCVCACVCVCVHAATFKDVAGYLIIFIQVYMVNYVCVCVQ